MFHSGHFCNRLSNAQLRYNCSRFITDRPLQKPHQVCSENGFLANEMSLQSNKQLTHQRKFRFLSCPSWPYNERINPSSLTKCLKNQTTYSHHCPSPNAYLDQEASRCWGQISNPTASTCLASSRSRWRCNLSSSRNGRVAAQRWMNQPDDQATPSDT